MNKTKVRVIEDVEQSRIKKGDIGYIDGYVQMANGVGYAVVVVGTIVDYVRFYSLEALSDKEEEIETGGWRIYKTKNGYWRYERNDGHYIDFKTVEAARLHAKEQNPEIEEPKQEKCNWEPVGVNVERCSKCNKWKYCYEKQITPCNPKQSTSLKEAVKRAINLRSPDEEVADKVLNKHDIIKIINNIN